MKLEYSHGGHEWSAEIDVKSVMENCSPEQVVAAAYDHYAAHIVGGRIRKALSEGKEIKLPTPEEFQGWLRSERGARASGEPTKADLAEASKWRKSLREKADDDARLEAYIAFVGKLKAAHSGIALPEMPENFAGEHLDHIARAIRLHKPSISL